METVKEIESWCVEMNMNVKIEYNRHYLYGAIFVFFMTPDDKLHFELVWAA